MATRTKRSGKKKPAARRSKSSPGRTRRVAGHLAPWARDAFGIGLVVLALLAVLGLWLHSGGLVGKVIAYLSRALIGEAAGAMPLFALYWGIRLLRRSAEDERVRMFLGFLITLAGAQAITSVARGNPAPVDGYTGVHAAGGLLGALVGWPLSKVASAPGAVIICLGLVVLGLLVFTGTPLSAVGGWLRDHLVRPAATPGSDQE